MLKTHPWLGSPNAQANAVGGIQLGIILTDLDGGMVLGGDEIVSPSGGSWIRVGRWMSTEELEQMKSSGVAQESRDLGGSRVALPASADAYKDAPAGSVYVEYDIPAGSAKSAGSRMGKNPGSQ